MNQLMINRIESLSPAEVNILDYKLSGLEMKEIAFARRVTHGTVKEQSKGIRDKLHCSMTIACVQYALYLNSVIGIDADRILQ